MDLEGQHVVSRRAGCTKSEKSRIWEDRIKRFVRSLGAERWKKRQRERERDREIDREVARRGG